jgi:hypothetical protein
LTIEKQRKKYPTNQCGEGKAELAVIINRKSSTIRQAHGGEQSRTIEN